MKNTYQELELLNGDIVKLTLNFARLLKIKNDNVVLYTKLMKVLQEGASDLIEDCLTVLYVGYLCANLQKNALSESEFIELIPFDLEKINEVAGNLVTGKKK